MRTIDAAPPDRRRPAAPRPPAKSGFDAGALIARLLRFSPLILLAVLAGGVCGWLALGAMPARYVSSVSILIDPKRPDGYGAEGAFANLYVDSAKISSVELVMTSSSLLTRVVREQHLADLPAYGEARPSGLRRRLSFILGPPETEPDTPDIREQRALYNLARSIVTQRIGMTYVVRVDVSGPTSELAWRLARAVADVYLDDQVRTKHDAAQRDAEWLTGRLNQQRVELMQSEDAVEAIRKRRGLTLTDSAPGSTVDRQSITDINAQLAQADGDVAAKQARWAQVERLQRSGGNLQGLPEVAASPVIGALRAQQANANRVVADLAGHYTALYPGLTAAQADLRTLNAQIAAETSRIADGIRNDAEAAASHRDALRRQLGQLVDKTGDPAGAAGRVELQEAQRVAEANRTVYDAALARLREVEGQQSRQAPEARIISPAVENGAPSSPKPVLFLGGGVALGLVTGLGLTFLLPLFERRVVSSDAAEQTYALPVIGKIPYLTRGELAGDGRRLTIVEYMTAKPLSRFAESLRAFRVGLRVSGRQTGTVVQITSSVPREGKSMTSATLAASAAAAGLRTVLVDLDFYRPSISAIFGCEAGEGAADVLSGGSITGAVLQRHRQLPLRIIAAGSPTRRRPHMVEAPQFRLFIDELRAAFDLVVLDTPPVLATSDAVLISEVADATVMIVAWRSTPRDKVDEAVALLRAGGAPLVGMALNKVKARSVVNYDGYSAGYAGYGEA